MIIHLLSVLLGLVILHVWIRYRRMGRIVDKLPGPTALPFLGCMLTLVGSKEHLWIIMRKLAREFPIMRIWFFTSAWVCLSNPDDIEIVLTNKTNLNKKAVYEYALPFLNTGLLTSSKEKWVHRRKIMNIGFHHNIMKRYVDIMGEHGEKLVAEIKSYGNETVQNIVPLFSDAMLKIVCESALSVNLDKLDVDLVRQYKKAIRDITNIIIYRATRPYIRNWMLNFLPIGRLQNRSIKIFHNFTDKIIQERREYHQRVKNLSYQDFVEDIDKTAINDTSEDQNKRLVMLDVLLSAEQDNIIDAEGIREEVHVFTAAGHDTTTVGVVYAVMLLAENPEIQDRARAEVIEICSKHEGKLNIAEIQKLEYLDRCIKETLRLYPPALQFTRHIDEDIQLKKYVIPAGVDVLVMIYDLHRNPDVWSEPNKFDPDRFLPKNIKKHHPFAYIPFSAGIRNCIGKKFALLEIKLIIANILYNFYLEPVDRTVDMKLEANITLQPCHPINVKFIKRNDK